ncbi:MAG: tetratricopeptide repeat protein [Sandaracinaceae bacterium]
MSVDRSKVQAVAQKHLAKGNYDKAIAEFRKIVQSEPDDIRTWLKIGDLYTRKGARREAIETYARVAAQYAQQGFFLKAVAVYKQILKLDPTRLDVQVKLAEQYEMLQLVSDALATYEQVAAGYARAGDIDGALKVLHKMTGLDPENIPIRIRNAEALSKAGRTKEAADEFEAGAALLKDQGRYDDYLKVAERLLFHRPNDVGVARELAQLYLERQDPKRALAKLQLCFKADPKDIATLEALAEAFRQLGQLPKTISVYKEVARIHQEAGRQEERARILKRVLELDPSDADARQGLAAFAGASQVRGDIEPPASAVVAPSQAPPPPSEEEFIEVYEEDDEFEVLEVDEDILMVDEEEILEVVEELPASEPAPAPVVENARPSIPPDVQREAQIARLLTECDVFLRYGLKAKVVEQLHAVLEIDPLHVEARERLKDLHLDEGRTEEAVTELLTLADILAEAEPESSVMFLQQVLELSPGNADAQRGLAELGISAPSAPVSVPPASVAQPESIPPEADEVFFMDDVDEATALQAALPADELPAGADRSYDPYPDADELQPLEVIAPAPTDDFLSLDDDGALDVGGDHTQLSPPLEALEAESRAALVPPPSRGAVVPSPTRDPLAPMSPQEFDNVPLRPSTPAAAQLEDQRLSGPPGEVEEILDEADFFLAQGLFSEARNTLSDALNQHPGHPLLAEKLREVDQLALAPRPVPIELDIDDQSFELAEKLAAEFGEVEDTQAGSDVLDVEQVFEQFKKGVEAQVAVEDTETHFDLGIAYKEMGLLDDAIGEFTLCLSNADRTCIAETMIGLCHIEKGSVTDAISHFKKGLYADQKGEREELGLYFELGCAYEMLEDPKEALYYFQKVQKRDATFRGVANRIAALSQPQAAPNSAALGQDDIDAAFDDLMGED